MEKHYPEGTSKSRLRPPSYTPEQNRRIDMTRETYGAENLLHIDLTTKFQGLSAYDKTQILDDNLCEIKQKLDTAVRSVDGSKIENIQIGHTKIHDNTAIIHRDVDAEGELEEIFDNDEGFVVYIAIKYKKGDDMELTLNIEKEHGDEVPCLDITAGEGEGGEEQKEETHKDDDIQENLKTVMCESYDICIDYSETMTQPDQEKETYEKIAKYGREEANRKGDVGRNISCSLPDYPKYIERESRQDSLEIINREQNNKSIEVPKNQNKLYSQHILSFIEKLNDDGLEEPKDVFTEDPRRKPTTKKECSGESMEDEFTEDIMEDTLKSGIITEDKSFVEGSDVNQVNLGISNKRGSIHGKKQISWNESTEEILDSEEDVDSVYILNGVVDGFSPVLKTISPTVS